MDRVTLNDLEGVGAAWAAAQRSVIGALLLWPDKLAGRIFHSAKAAYFGNSALRHVFEAALGLWMERRPIDPVTVFKAAGDEYGDLIAECMKTVPTSANLDEYLHILQDEARLSGLRGIGSALAFSHNEEEAQAAYEEAGRLLREMENIEDLSLAECVSDYLDRMGDQTPPDYLKLGIPQLDNLLNIGAGKFVILAADSSVGKTALALQFAYHIAESGKKVGFFSLETDAHSLTDRLLAEKQVAGIALPRSKSKALSDTDYKRATDVGLRASQIPLRLIRKATTIEQIRGRTIQRGFDVIFIDYVQLIDAAGKERWDIVTNVSIGLHRMAQELGVTVFGLSQITPPSKDQKKAPTKDDLRESRQLKHDADVILIMSISTEGAGVFRELQVAKNKDGALGRMLLDFDFEHMTFSYRPPTQQNPYREIQAAAKKAARTTYKTTPGQQGFYEMGPMEGGELPF